MPEFILMRGISGSGKSHAARDLQSKYGYVVVCRDDLRLALYGVAFGPPINEDYITDVEFAAIELALRQNISVVSDNTHLKPKAVRERLDLAASCGATLKYAEIEATLATALTNNAKRAANGGRYVPEHVITVQAHAFDKHRDNCRRVYDNLSATTPLQS